MNMLNIIVYSKNTFYLDEIIQMLRESGMMWNIFTDNMELDIGKIKYAQKGDDYYFALSKQIAKDSRYDIALKISYIMCYTRAVRYNARIVSNYYGDDIKFNTDINNRFIKTRYYIQYENEASTIISTYYCCNSLDDIKKSLREILVDNKILYRERELRAIKNIKEMKKYCAEHGAVLKRINDVFKVKMNMEIEMPF